MPTMRHMDGYFATCGYYADFMAGYLNVQRGKLHVVYPGLNLKGHGGPAAFREEHPLVRSAFSPGFAGRKVSTTSRKPSGSCGECRKHPLANCASLAGSAKIIAPILKRSWRNSVTRA